MNISLWRTFVRFNRAYVLQVTDVYRYLSHMSFFALFLFTTQYETIHICMLFNIGPSSVFRAVISGYI